jgi:hypothetical protein
MHRPRRPRSTETTTVVRLSDELTTALRAILDSSSFAGLGPIELARILGVNKSFTSRLMTALRASDPVVALSLFPGVVPMRQFLAAALEHGASARAVQTAERKLRAFDLEVQRTFGTRTRLDAALADAVPQARRRQEDVARQAVYRGMALIKGVSMDLESFTWIVLPSRKHSGRVDIVFLAGFVGVHRLRPTARVRVGASYTRARPAAGPKIVRKFCRPEGVSIARSAEKDFTFYEISTSSVRRDAAADVFLTELLEGAAARAHSDKEGWSANDVLTYPVKRLELIVLVHDDVWRGCDFSLRVYETAMRGLVRVPDAERDFDRLPIDSTVVRSPATPESLRASLVPNYAELIRHLIAPHGWELETVTGRPTFRSFRCEIAYPLYGTQIVLVRE